MEVEQSCAGDQPNSAVQIRQHCRAFRKSKHKGRVPALSITPVPLSQKLQDKMKNV
jgi:hypothetical protein